MLYVNPRLKDDDLYNIYRRDYFIRKNYSFKDYGYGNYDLTGSLRDKTFLRWYSEAEPYLPVRRGNALDIGCATGRFLNILLQKGWNVKGIELDEGMCSELRSKNFDVTGRPVEFFETTEKFDLITLFDVVEHIPRLNQSMAKIAEMLSVGGSALIVTPNVSSLQRKIFGRRWFQFKPREHISYFSPETIRLLADRNGFKIVFLTTSCGQYADLSFIHHRLQRYGFNAIALLLKKILHLPGLKNLSWYIPTGSMMVILQKK